MIWRGHDLYGGIQGGLVAGVWMAREYVFRQLAMLDFAALGLALGLVLGKASDLMTGDHLGKLTGLPWGLRYVRWDAPGADLPLGTIVHPVALYDLVSIGILFVVGMRFLRKARAPGSAAAQFAIWYGTGRIFLDFLRGPGSGVRHDRHAAGFGAHRAGGCGVADSP
jgi:phosphatidylglycerol:prolipoprotein diacylglycerol transferase